MTNPNLSLPHAGSVVTTKLRGNPGEILTLPGPAVGGAPYNPLMLQWNPEDRRALEVELRARIVEIQFVGGGIAASCMPNVRWYVELGHGSTVWTRPSKPLVTGTTIKTHLLPARGLMLRASVREMKFFVGVDPFPADNIVFAGLGGTIAQVKVQVSYQPVVSQLAAWPRQDVTIGGEIFQFPMEANEFRVRDQNGQAFGGGAGPGFVFIGPTVGPLFASTADLYADWSPIPDVANSWEMAAIAPSTVALVEYR